MSVVLVLRHHAGRIDSAALVVLQVTWPAALVKRHQKVV
jgi:hypothetical protein